MILSHEKKFIFIHIYKTAGTSVSEALKGYASAFPLDAAINLSIAAWRKLIGVPPPFLDRMLRYPGHIDAATLRDRIGHETFDAFYKFCFVRNPWDWAVSMYSFGRQSRDLEDSGLYSSLSSFEDYVHLLGENRAKGNFRTQKSFISDGDGKLLVDKVGRVENIDGDFAEICGNLGVDAQLNRYNASKRRPYQAYYTDKLVDLVRDVYIEDVVEFGYEFELAAR